MSVGDRVSVELARPLFFDDAGQRISGMRHTMEPALHTSDRAESDLTLRVVRAAAEAVIAHADELTALDQAIGDGDHGINMKRGLEAVLADLPQLQDKPLGEMLKAIGMKLVMKVGGASGPLYGTLAMELGKHMPRLPRAATWRQRFAAAIEAVKARGKSDVGQKTMLDVLAPVQAKLAEGADPARHQGRGAARRRSDEAGPGASAAAPRSSASARSATWIRARARRRSSSRRSATRWRGEAWRMWAS